MLTAARACQALLLAGHEVATVFFSDAATAVGQPTLELPQDEINVQAEWQALTRAYGIPLVLCVSSALQRGLTTAAPGADDTTATVAEGFSIGGLGQLVSGSASADRVLTFGG
jgi:tRNA 2-thiouridine synthesizing protein D